MNGAWDFGRLSIASGSVAGAQASIDRPARRSAESLSASAPRGPHDEHVAYSRLPGFLQRLSARGFDVVAQATPHRGS